MLSADDALAKAAATKVWAVGMCDNFVANMFGFSSSGYATASSNWAAIPAQDKHPGDTNAPAGALLFWGGGAGHVAISDGKGGAYSTDISGPGTVTHVEASEITNNWHKQYLGWSVPYFQGQAGTTGVYTGGGGTVPNDTVSQSSAISTNPFYWLVGQTSGTDFTDTLQRFGLILLGAAFVIVGVWKFTSFKGVNPVRSVGKAKKNGLTAVSTEAEETEESA